MVQHDDAPLDAYGYVSGDGGIRVIGVFSSKKKAENTVKKIKNKKGFRCFSESFHIEELTVGNYKWTDGFYTQK